MGVIVSVVTSNAVAVACGTEGVYESELEANLGLNYLSQVGSPYMGHTAAAASALNAWVI